MSSIGVTAKDKIIKLRETLAETKAIGMVVSMLDEVAWLFNLRGSDIEFNPGKSLRYFYRYSHDSVVTVFFAYAVVTHNDAILYVDGSQISDAVRTHLGKEVAIKPYDAIWDDLKHQRQSLESTEKDVCMS